MSKLLRGSKKVPTQLDLSIIEVKSKFDAEFRRFPLDKTRLTSYEDFYKHVQVIHKLQSIPFSTWYTDMHGDLLPINNDDNFLRAVTTARPLLRVFVQRKGGSVPEENALPPEVPRRRNLLSNLTNPAKSHLSRISISGPQDFRRVSAIVDVDIIPETQRRVKLLKHNTDKPLGFYIRDGTSVRVTPSGLEKVPGIFISRLVPGGLAESTGLLAVNDEVLEVNGIEVAGKTLDQVTDMMIANSHNLIITVKPSNQFNNPVLGRLNRTEPDRMKSQSLTNLATHSIHNPVITTGSPTMHHAYHNELAEEIPDSDEEDHPTVDEDGILSI
ncbi:partitioning defective 6 homolog gamma-like [Stylophora pistillata]|uniref:Partitioning defective 6-like gamma n=1 Tax=Stylophora pistillata TaxID=50429 RepID=A0A2B4SHM7_STYPI|nr:partitioning defective 6 homolog gamma-like [Stylophora pistillata]PFX27992.1 Partitioning defective 6-like gamma [Stylophora pistillata]